MRTRLPDAVAESAVARTPRLRRRLREHLGPRSTDLLKSGVDIVTAKDRSLQRPLGDERQECVAVGL